MAKTLTKEEKFKQMVQTPVNQLIPRLAVPTIISMLVTSIYNMADTFFVSQIGTSASGAVGIIFSAMAMIQAVGFTLGMGSGNNISRALGNREEERASVFAATAFFTAGLIGILVLVFGIFSGSNSYDRSLCTGLCQVYPHCSAFYDVLVCDE